MAENKGIMLAKSVQKHAGRAKEKLLQNLGKVDRTADEIFDDHLNNFNRQQTHANKLQKEFNNYIRCIRAVQTASKSLMDAISEIYEPHWSGFDALQAQTGASESLWQDFAHKLGDQVLIPLNTYTGQFPEMKKKIEKRNRKLIDYDGQRHSFQNLQANANKRKDDVKLTKGREQLEEARRTYEILNTELHDELPALYDSRILFLVTNLQTLFATEQLFHNETSKIYSELEAIVDKLATESQRGSNTLRKQATNPIKSSSPVQSPVKPLNNANVNSNYQNQITTNGSSNINSPTSSSSEQEARLDSISPTPESTPENLKGGSTPSSPTTSTSTNEPSYQNTPVTNTTNSTIPATQLTTSTTENDETTDNPENKHLNSQNANVTESDKTTANTTTTKTATTEEVVNSTTKVLKGQPQIPTEKLNGNGNGNENENGNNNTNTATSVATNNGNVEDNKKTLDATTADLPPGVLYRVKATYGYVKEDVDELSFEIGDMIRVIEYDDPEDQEEGWLMGQKEGTNEKGLFPANFTRPI
ncbi:myc box-dependent-interacting protein 1 isoform X2 [Teleopsis dalmanni]|uniref:myc box-dependent-interacting protein 1 isoform X2 n=1 Tax=Teleopsis dalmanni TaxID=139649 RepID=UPI0018CF6DD0|nr:myc box-dependent-interacting protein 1 isoform X2 [Teleopsis dalmanni]